MADPQDSRAGEEEEDEDEEEIDDTVRSIDFGYFWSVLI